MRAKPAVVNSDPRLLVKHEGRLRFLLPLQLAQGPHFVADKWVTGVPFLALRT